MKALVAVIAALVIVGIAALGLFRAQQLSLPTDHAAGPAFRDQGTPADQPSTSMTAWPDLYDLTNDDSRPTRAASLDGSEPSRPSDIQLAPAHALTTLSNADDIAPRPPASPPRVVPHKNRRTSRVGQRQH
jgi:hypothetical protein